MTAAVKVFAAGAVPQLRAEVGECVSRQRDWDGAGVVATPGGCRASRAGVVPASFRPAGSAACPARARPATRPAGAGDGLLKAISNFDPALGRNLDAYARPCVAGEMKRHFRDKRWQIRVHRTAQELRLRIRDETSGLAQQLARQPTDADLAEHLQVSQAEIADAQLASHAYQIARLDSPATRPGGTPRTLADNLGTDDDRLEMTITMAAVWQHCAELLEREQLMLMMRFYGNMTQAQIGTELGISQMHVSRLLNHALTFLRDRVTATRD